MLLDEVAYAMMSYFEGEEVDFDFPLDLSSGTAFRQEVWRAALKVPYGSVWTYGQLAEAAGHPRAARAVGGALAANPLPILVPCHRIVTADGLGGFMGSRDTGLKAVMLGLERSTLIASEISKSLLTRQSHLIE